MLPDSTDILHSGALDNLENYRVFKRRYPRRVSLPTKAISDWHLQETPFPRKPRNTWICLVGVCEGERIRTSPIVSVISPRKVCTSDCIYVLGTCTRILEHPVRGLERLFAEGFPSNWEELVKEAFSGISFSPSSKACENIEVTPVLEWDAVDCSVRGGSGGVSRKKGASIGCTNNKVPHNAPARNTAMPSYPGLLRHDSEDACTDKIPCIEYSAISYPKNRACEEHDADFDDNLSDSIGADKLKEHEVVLSYNGDVNDSINALLRLSSTNDCLFADHNELPEGSEALCNARCANTPYPTVEEAVRTSPFRPSVDKWPKHHGLAKGRSTTAQPELDKKPRLNSGLPLTIETSDNDCNTDGPSTKPILEVAKRTVSDECNTGYPVQPFVSKVPLLERVEDAPVSEKDSITPVPKTPCIAKPLGKRPVIRIPSRSSSERHVAGYGGTYFVPGENSSGIAELQGRMLTLNKRSHSGPSALKAAKEEVLGMANPGRAVDSLSLGGMEGLPVKTISSLSDEDVPVEGLSDHRASPAMASSKNKRRKLRLVMPKRPKVLPRRKY